ncbi:MAG: YebC/PmpR family DNA-binding transcriptional regulator [Patescibacteria group bacterium]
MSGHSKWATTHRQKESADAKRSAVFTRLANMITIAAKESGTDLESNFKLRLVVDKARAANMPKDNIERAVKRGSGASADGANFEEIVYEVFGPANSAFILEGVTDNRNRTVSDLKSVLNKNGGQLAGPNSVLWLFDKKGFVEIKKEKLAGNALDDLELSLIDAGAEDIDQAEDWTIKTLPENLQKVLDKLKELNIGPSESGLEYVAKSPVKLSPEDRERIHNLFDLLSDLNDITNVYTNAE